MTRRGAEKNMASVGESNVLDWAEYGRCTGVNYNKIVIPPHVYSDGKMHFKDSDGLCPGCYKIVNLIRDQGKISRLEEKLNGEKNVLEKMV